MCVKQSKVCSKCKVDKPSGEYTIRTKKIARQNGTIYELKQLLSMCKECKRKESLAANMSESRLKRKRENDIRRAIRLGNQTSHRSRAKKGGGEYGIVDTELVFERDNWTCYLCGVKVERAKQYKPNRATVDHVIPLSKGGSHTYDNVKTCCNWCNCSKHDKT